MDETLSAEERTALRVEALRTVRAILAEQAQRLPQGMRFGIAVFRTTPTERDQFNHALDQPRRAGEHIYASDDDWSPVVPVRSRRTRQEERVATAHLEATIKRVLVRLDREPLG